MVNGIVTEAVTTCKTGTVRVKTLSFTADSL